VYKSALALIFVSVGLLAGCSGGGGGSTTPSTGLATPATVLSNTVSVPPGATTNVPLATNAEIAGGMTLMTGASWPAGVAATIAAGGQPAPQGATRTRLSPSALAIVRVGSVVTSNSGATGSSATGGTGATNGGADMTPVYNLGGTVDSSATTGPVAGALGATAPQAKQRRPQ
jgi:hypothetical protein